MTASVLNNCHVIIRRLVETAVGEQHALLKNLYSELKKLSKFEPGTSILTDDHTTIITITVNTLLKIIGNSEIAVALLAGTCLALFLQQMFVPSQAACFFGFLLSLHGRDTIGNHPVKNCQSKICVIEDSEIRQYLCDNPQNETIDNSEFWKNISESPKQCEIITLSILYGILSCCKEDVQLHKIQNNQIFFIQLFDNIIPLCSPLCKFVFHAFQVLLTWAKTAPIIVTAIHRKFKDDSNHNLACFSSDSFVVQTILNVLEANWENSLNGIPEAVKNIYKALIEANAKEIELINTSDKFVPLKEFLLQKTMKVNWETKGKYVVLSSLLPYISSQEFLLKYPDAPNNIIFNMRTNYMASVVCDVYKILAVNKNIELHVCEKYWSSTWSIPIITGLYSNDKLLLQNINNYILPWTLKTFPNSFTLLSAALCNKRQNSMANITLLRIAVDANVVLDNAKTIEILKENMHHSSENLRLEVFSIMCSSFKRSEFENNLMYPLIQEFLLWNLNIDCSAFNQRLISQIKILLTKIRVTSIGKFDSMSLVSGSPEYLRIEFIERLVRIALRNTYPGACYQRRRTCLQILNAVYHCFIEAPSGETKKENPSGPKVRQLISLAQSNGFWMFFNDNSLLQLFPCMLDFTEDIRSSAAYLLEKHYNWPDLSNTLSGINASDMLKFALELSNSFHIQNTDSGSLICRIVFVRYIVQKQLLFDFDAQNFIKPGNCETSVGLVFLANITKIARLKLEKLRLDFVAGVSTAPIHGILESIKQCISYDSFLEKVHSEYANDTMSLVNCIILVCHDTIKTMLTIMSGDTKSDIPSFGDIGVALDNLLPIKRNDKSESSFYAMCIYGKHEKCSAMSDNFDVQIDSFAMSQESQLLLSCCWHSIKNSCFLLCEVLKPVLNFDTEISTQKKCVEDIVNILSSTLLKCRHKGVIEACSSTLNQCCRSLLSAKKCFDDIPMNLLRNGFETLNDTSLTSVTRRSAGLPLLVHSIVSAEEGNQNDKLISFAINRSLVLLNMPLDEDYNETKDLPQSHSFHILKILISDAKMYHKLSPWLGAIVSSCITGFSAKCWAIRNGALQLFGVLLPRLCGQKKTREHSQHNLIYPNELFGRCPELYCLLLRRLQKSTEALDKFESHCNPELIPILSLIATLSPFEDNSINRKFIDDFKPLLFVLVSSSLWYIRDVASTALCNIIGVNDTDFIELLQSAFLLTRVKNNLVHGILMTIQKSLEIQKEKNSSVLHILNENCASILENSIWCSANKVLLLNIVSTHCDITNIHKLLPQLLHEITTEDFGSVAAGSLWREQCFVMYLKCSNTTDVISLIEKQMFKSQESTNACLKFLTSKLQNSEKKFDICHWKFILSLIIDHIETSCHQAFMVDTLEFISTLCNVGKDILDCSLSLKLQKCMKQLIIRNYGLTVTGLALAIASLALRATIGSTKNCSVLDIEFWIGTFCSFCPPRQSEVLRFYSAQFINNAGWPTLKYITSNLNQNPLYTDHILRLCDGCLHLLQDEEEDIRKIASSFASQLPHKYKVSCIQFNVAIDILCGFITGQLGSNESFIQYLWCKYRTFPSVSCLLQARTATNKTALFEQEYINVFAEPVQLSAIYFSQLQVSLKRLYELDPDICLEKIKIFSTDLKYDIQETKTVLEEYQLGKSSILYMSYLSQPTVSFAVLNLKLKAESLCRAYFLHFKKETDVYVEDILITICSDMENITRNFPEAMQGIFFAGKGFNYEIDK